MIELGFVNRFYALARFFVTFFGAFTAFAAPRVLELAGAFRSGFLAPLEAGFPTFWEALAPLPAALAGFLDALASTAPIAARMRPISRVTCSMVIMPSTVSSLRRSE